MQCGIKSCPLRQGGHKPGKPGILRDFCEHGKFREFCATSGKNCNKQSIFSSSFKYLCKTAVDWVNSRAVPEFGSGSGRNPAFFTNPADIRLRSKLGRMWNFALFGKLLLNNTNLNNLYIQNLFPTTYNCSINGVCSTARQCSAINLHEICVAVADLWLLNYEMWMFGFHC